MWCAHCQADVAAEAMSDNRRLRCATCGTDLSPSNSPTEAGKTRDARELLARWSSSALLDPFGPSWDKRSRHSSDAPKAENRETGEPQAGQADSPKGELPNPGREERSPRQGAPSSGEVPQKRAEPVYHVHPPHRLRPDAEESRGVRLREQDSAAESAPPQSAAGSVAGPRIDVAHEHTSGPPHFDVQAAMGTKAASKTNWVSLAGQLLAYGGVAVLTWGTTLVLRGYFAGPEETAATGWLIATAGQMLLFLGVITLVSGGMEQTTEEVARRIDFLGEKIVRIEQASRAQRGPHFPADSFAEGDSTASGNDSRMSQIPPDSSSPMC